MFRWLLPISSTSFRVLRSHALRLYIDTTLIVQEREQRMRTAVRLKEPISIARQDKADDPGADDVAGTSGCFICRPQTCPFHS